MARRLTALAGLAAILFAFVACAPAGMPTGVPETTPAAAPTNASDAGTPSAIAASPEPASIKFGGIPSAAFAALYLAADKGYFQEQGINMQVTDFSTVQDLIAPLGTGQLDVIAMPLSTPLLAAVDRNIELKMVAAASMTAPNFEHNWIMVRKDLWDSGQVKTVSDLKGMKIAIPSQGSIGDQTVQMMLTQAGMKKDEVDIEVLPTAETSAAFANKAIAAGYVMEPQVATCVQKGFATKWIPVSSFFGGKAQTSVVVYGPALLKNKELAQRWMLGYIKGVREYLKDIASKDTRGDVVKAVINHTPVKDATLYDMMELPYVDPNGLPDKNSIEAQYKWWVENGFYKGQSTFDAITDLSYTDYAVQKLGKQ